MPEQWSQIGAGRWRKELATASGALIVETVRTTLSGGYFVAIHNEPPRNGQGLTIWDLHTMAQAQEVGDGLLTQFAHDQLPGTDLTITPL